MLRNLLRSDRHGLIGLLACAVVSLCGCESESRTTATTTDSTDRPAATSPADAVVDQDAERAKDTLRKPRRDQAKRPAAPAADRGLRVVDQPRVTPSR